MSPHSFAALARRFIRTRHSVAAVEFALVGMWAIGMIMAILNLGMLSFSLGTLAHGVQGAAREAVTVAANSAVTSNNDTFKCPTSAQITGYFNQLTNGGLPPAGANPYLSVTWTNAGATSTGVNLVLAGTYKWAPFGFPNLFPNLFTLNIATMATVTGTTAIGTTYQPNIDASCQS